MDTEERARELSFLAYEVKEIEEAQLSVGEDTRLEEQYRRFANAKRSWMPYRLPVQLPGRRRYRRECIGTYQPCPAEVSSVSAYEERIAQMEQMLTDIDNLLSDFNHEISSYLSGRNLMTKSFIRPKRGWMRSIT